MVKISYEDKKWVWTLRELRFWYQNNCCKIPQ